MGGIKVFMRLRQAQKSIRAKSLLAGKTQQKKAIYISAAVDAKWRLQALPEPLLQPLRAEHINQSHSAALKW